MKEGEMEERVSLRTSLIIREDTLGNEVTSMAGSLACSRPPEIRQRLLLGLGDERLMRTSRDPSVIALRDTSPGEEDA